jgi:hypothetical protein
LMLILYEDDARKEPWSTSNAWITYITYKKS